MKLIWPLTLLILFSCINAFSFVLTYEKNFQIKNHKDATVHYASGSCTGISDSEMVGAIKNVLEDYWNTISESSLFLRYEKAVTIASLTTSSRSGSILVGCMAMGAGGSSGVAYTTESTGQSVIFLNDTTFQPGGYSNGAVEGVLAHEVGHALGLHHTKDNASVMTYETHDWSIRPKYLSQDDKDGIVYLYPQESKALGLLGSCNVVEEAFAGDQDRQLGVLSWLVNFLFGVLIVVIIRKIIRRVQE